MCLEQGFSNLMCIGTTGGLLRQIAGHWGGARSICVSNKFPGTAAAAGLSIMLEAHRETSQSLLELLMTVLPSYEETGSSLPTPHAHLESHKYKWGCFAHHCNNGEMMNCVNVASNLPKALEEVYIVGVCEGETLQGEHLAVSLLSPNTSQEGSRSSC